MKSTKRQVGNVLERGKKKRRLTAPLIIYKESSVNE